jgi:hypothetical protein
MGKFEKMFKTEPTKILYPDFKPAKINSEPGPLVCSIKIKIKKGIEKLEVVKLDRIRIDYDKQSIVGVDDTNYYNKLVKYMSVDPQQCLIKIGATDMPE